MLVSPSVAVNVSWQAAPQTATQAATTARTIQAKAFDTAVTSPTGDEMAALPYEYMVGD